jgi:putative ATP-dependent endonuclease of OLD family
VHFSKDANATTVSRFHNPGDAALDSEDLRAINRRVLNTRGELLFSRCVILFEGETEEQALPRFAEMHWTRHPNDIGVSFIAVGGSGNYLPFLRLTTKFRIPWVVLSDGEDQTIKDVNRALEQVNESPVDKNSRCVVLPDSNCFEAYLTTATALDALRSMIASYKIESGQVSDARGIENITSSWASKTEAELLAELLAHKTTYGARIADAYATIAEAEHRIPAKLREAFDIAWPGTAPTADQEPADAT